MGRYYNGDIEGKFWFGLQSSDAADRFGYEGTTTHLDYYFDQEELPTVEAEIKSIEESIDVQKIDDFFFIVLTLCDNHSVFLSGFVYLPQ